MQVPAAAIGIVVSPSTMWPVGLMDEASASGAGDSRFESWAGHLFTRTTVVVPCGAISLYVQASPHTCTSISGLVVEYIVAIDVTRIRFPADVCVPFCSSPLPKSCVLVRNRHAKKFAQCIEYHSRHQPARINYQRSGAAVSLLGL